MLNGQLTATDFFRFIALLVVFALGLRLALELVESWVKRRLGKYDFDPDAWTDVRPAHAHPVSTRKDAENTQEDGVD